MDAAQARFQKSVEQIKQEHDNTLDGLKLDLAAVNKLMGAEQRRLGNTPPVSKAQPQPRELAQQPKAPQPRARMPLAEMMGLQRAG
jgi:hypothetical protein